MLTFHEQRKNVCGVCLQRLGRKVSVEIGELTGADGEPHRPLCELRWNRGSGILWKFQKSQQLREPVSLFPPCSRQKPTRRGVLLGLGLCLPDK